MRIGCPSRLWRSAVVFSMAILISALPGHFHHRAQAKKAKVLKVATIVPRSGRSAREAKKAIKRLKKRTQGRVTARVYWSGAAGDEKTVLRKMRIGQVDASYLGLEIIRHFVPQAMVLGAPNTFTTYKQVDAVREALTPDFDTIAYRNGFKILGWGDAGVIRIFSVTPVRKLKDFRTMRPWVYEQSPLLKEFYRIVGCRGVPVGLIDVYSALQTGLIDVVWSSALVAMLLRWHAHTKYVSKPVGLLQGGFVMRRGFWEELEERDRQAMLKMAEEDRTELQDFIRETDENVYQRFFKRGIKLVPFANTSKWVAAGKRLRDRMVGRLYTREMLSRMEGIISRFPDDPETPDGFR